MARARRGLGGKARAQTYRSASDSLVPKERHEELVEVRPERLMPSPWQPREAMGAAELERLAASIRALGILEPLLARRDGDGGLVLLAGHRRREAALAAGHERVPVRVLDVSDATAQAITITENLARTDLSPWEEARGIASLRDALREAGETFTRDRLAELIGRSTGTVSTALAIADRLAPALAEMTKGDRQSLTGLPQTALHRASRPDEPAARRRLLEAGLQALAEGEAPGTAVAHALKGERPGPSRRAFTMTDRLTTSGRLSLHLRRSPEKMTHDEARDLLARLEQLAARLRERAESPEEEA